MLLNAYTKSEATELLEAIQMTWRITDLKLIFTKLKSLATPKTFSEMRMDKLPTQLEISKFNELSNTWVALSVANDNKSYATPESIAAST